MIKRMEQKGRTLYKQDGRYYRLFAWGITPNRCWLIGARMIELIDIDAASGEDVYGEDVINYDIGIIQAGIEYIRCYN